MTRHHRAQQAPAQPDPVAKAHATDPAQGNAALQAGNAVQHAPVSPCAHRLWQRARRHPGLWIGGCMTLLLLACSLLGVFWTPHSPIEIDMHNRLAPASARHWLGTDALGRDVASQLLAGARSPLLVGLGAVSMGLGLGSLLGLLAAQQRGWVEACILKFTDVAFAFPALLTAITHGSTLVMVLSILFFGGETLHYFAVALTIGILFGVYSSVFVATSMALWLGIKREDLLKKGGGSDKNKHLGSSKNDPNAGAVV